MAGVAATWRATGPTPRRRVASKRVGRQLAQKNHFKAATAFWRWFIAAFSILAMLHAFAAS
jgi:hypothetical protein